MILGATMAAGAAHGATLEEADALFERRGEEYLNKSKSFEERAKIAQDAMAMYQELLPGTTGSERAYIGSKISRLYIYIGDYLISKSEKSKRRDHFKACQDFIVQEMSPELLGEDNLQPYYYQLASCWAFKLEMSNVLVQLREKGGLERLVYEGTAYAGGTDYLAGGIHRSLAGVRSSKAAIAIGAGDVVEARDEALAALETIENSKYNNYSIAGTLYCDNYRYLADAYVADPNSSIYSKDEATNVLLNAFDALEVSGSADDFEIGYKVPGAEVDNLVCVERLFAAAAQHGLEL